MSCRSRCSAVAVHRSTCVHIQRSSSYLTAAQLSARSSRETRAGGRDDTESRELNFETARADAAQLLVRSNRTLRSRACSLRDGLMVSTTTCADGSGSSSSSTTHPRIASTSSSRSLTIRAAPAEAALAKESSMGSEIAKDREDYFAAEGARELGGVIRLHPDSASQFLSMPSFMSRASIVQLGTINRKARAFRELSAKVNRLNLRLSRSHSVALTPPGPRRPVPDPHHGHRGSKERINLRHRLLQAAYARSMAARPLLTRRCHFSTRP